MCYFCLLKFYVTATPKVTMCYVKSGGLCMYVHSVWQEGGRGVCVVYGQSERGGDIGKKGKGTLRGNKLQGTAPWGRRQAGCSRQAVRIRTRSPQADAVNLRRFSDGCLCEEAAVSPGHTHKSGREELPPTNADHHIACYIIINSVLYFITNCVLCFITHCVLYFITNCVLYLITNYVLYLITSCVPYHITNCVQYLIINCVLYLITNGVEQIHVNP